MDIEIYRTIFLEEALSIKMLLEDNNIDSKLINDSLSKFAYTPSNNDHYILKVAKSNKELALKIIKEIQLA